MKWLALLLLTGNLAYLGWELDRSARALTVARPSPQLHAGVGVLEKIDETTGVRELKPVYGWQTPRRVLVPRRR